MSMEASKTQIYLAAAGYGTRMRGAMDAMGYAHLPKHLLPTGEDDNATLLGRNLRLARASGQKTLLLVNEQNQRSIADHPDIEAADDDMMLDPHHALGPFSFVEFARQASRPLAASAAGDVFVDDFNWTDLLAYHQQSPFPVTFAVGRVAAGANSAVFDINEAGEVEGFRRLVAEEPAVYRNIGLYAVDLTPPVLDIFREYTGKANEASLGRQDEIAADLVSEGLVRAYLHEGPFFNINTPADYDALLAHTDRLAEAM